MLYRLRIAASVFFAMVCVALIVLWARSYWTADSPTVNLGDRTLWAQSLDGSLVFAVDRHWYPFNRWHTPTAEHVRSPNILYLPSVFGFDLGKTSNDGYYAAFHHWFLILVSAAIAAASWQPFRWQFSLRTVLIATTLLAVVLGTVCYNVR
jgi:hypothetical protein